MKFCVACQELQEVVSTPSALPCRIQHSLEHQTGHGVPQHMRTCRFCRLQCDHGGALIPWTVGLYSREFLLDYTELFGVEPAPPLFGHTEFRGVGLCHPCFSGVQKFSITGLYELMEPP